MLFVLHPNNMFKNNETPRKIFTKFLRENRVNLLKKNFTFVFIKVLMDVKTECEQKNSKINGKNNKFHHGKK